MTKDYYTNDGQHDLFYYFRNGLLTPDEYRGFLKGNIFKYTTRYNAKGQKKADLEKLNAYTKELNEFERFRAVQIMSGNNIPEVNKLREYAKKKGNKK